MALYNACIVHVYQMWKSHMTQPESWEATYCMKLLPDSEGGFHLKLLLRMS